MKKLFVENENVSDTSIDILVNRNVFENHIVESWRNISLVDGNAIVTHYIVRWEKKELTSQAQKVLRTHNNFLWVKVYQEVIHTNTNVELAQDIFNLEGEQ